MTRKIKTIKSTCIFLLLAIASSMSSFGQSSKEILEQRANQMHETIRSSDESQWENYVKTNYSKRMLEKYDMTRHVGMFKRLNKDFSDSKISSLKIVEDKVLMAIERNTDKHKVTFEINYDKDDDYKFNGFSIEAGELR